MGNLALSSVISVWVSRALIKRSLNIFLSSSQRIRGGVAGVCLLAKGFHPHVTATPVTNDPTVATTPMTAATPTALSHAYPMIAAELEEEGGSKHYR